MDAHNSSDILLFGPFRFDRAAGSCSDALKTVVTCRSASAPVRSQCSRLSPNGQAIS